MNSKPIQEDLIALRKSLHQHPEIAGEEDGNGHPVL